MFEQIVPANRLVVVVKAASVGASRRRSPAGRCVSRARRGLVAARARPPTAADVRVDMIICDGPPARAATAGRAFATDRR